MVRKCINVTNLLTNFSGPDDLLLLVKFVPPGVGPGVPPGVVPLALVTGVSSRLPGHG